MKIAVWHNLPSGGAKRALYYHVRGLAARGHKLSCWSLDTADHSFLPLSAFAPERIVPTQTNGSPHGTFIRRLAPHYSEMVERLRRFDEACRRCAHEIEAGSFDLLFANSSLDFYVPYVLRHLRMRKVLYLQEPGRYLYEARPVLPWVETAPDDLRPASLLRPRRWFRTWPNLQSLRLQAKQEWLNMQACDRVLVNSYFSRESVLRSYGVDARVCYLGVDTQLFRILDLERERFVVGLGSFDAIKGIESAILALSLLAEPRPPLVWIANSGSEDYQQKMNTLARSRGVDLRVRMGISDDEVVEILNRATLLICTSRLEPFGLAPLEANACGLPVVAIAEGGLRETVRDGINGFLVQPDVASIARATSQLLEKPGLAREMGMRAIDYVKQDWTVEHSIDRLEHELLEVAADKSS
jgi:glycosyltransferase involved in cell wall biosynthesis